MATPFDPSIKLAFSHTSSSQEIRKDAIFTVELVSSQTERSVMRFPLQCLLDREEEMRMVAEQFNIDPASWNGSRLYKMYATQKRLSLTLFPERDCAAQNYSHALKWSDWLTQLMQSYYEKSQICIPDACRGHDLLLALEYLGILYQPDQLQFSSYPTYARVKHWSDYFTHRTALGDWVADRVLEQGGMLFGTTLDPDVTVHVDGQRVHPLLCINSTSQASQNSLMSAAAVYDFFNVSLPEEDPAYVDRAEAAALMRRDFSEYMQHILTNIQASFTMTAVTSAKGVEERAVLRIDVVASDSPPRSVASGSLDEVMQRLKEAKKLEENYG